MPTTISDLWIPDIWLQTMREKQATFPTLLNSGVVVDNPRASELASGPGEVATIPFFKDITDQDDEIQVENAEPTVDNKITSGQMKAVACNRVCKSSATAFAAQLSGEDPVGEIVAQMAQRRLKQRQKTLLAMVRGAFGSVGASGVAAPLKDGQDGIRAHAADGSERCAWPGPEGQEIVPVGIESGDIIRIPRRVPQEDRQGKGKAARDGCQPHIRLLRERLNEEDIEIVLRNKAVR